MSSFADFGVNYQTKTLKNQTKLILIQRKGAPVYIQALIKAGSRYNSVSGQAHFAEHMLVLGTKSYPTKLALSNVLEEIGGFFHASTDPDFLRITISIPEAKNIKLAISVLNEILTESLFDEAVFENEKSVILREQKERFSRSKSSALMETLASYLYPDFSAQANTLGTKESVSNMSLEDIRNFVKTHIVAQKTTFVVVGDIEVDKIEAELSSIKLPEGVEVLHAPLLPTVATERLILKKEEGDTTNLLLGFRLDIDNIQEVVGFFLIRQIFVGRSGLLMQELRYKRGLVYGGDVWFWNFSESSIFAIGTICAKEKTDIVFEVILEILNSVLKNGISEGDCEKLKIKLKSLYRFNLESSKEWLELESRVFRHRKNSDEKVNAMTILTEIDNMNAKTLTNIFRKYINTKNAYGLINGAVSDEAAEVVKKLLSNEV